MSTIVGKSSEARIVSESTNKMHCCPEPKMMRTIVLLSLTVAFVPQVVIAAQASRPNLLIFVADQLSRESCGYAGNPTAITPTIDRLAAQGIEFQNYVVNTPVSSATRATLWTGKYASTTGMIVNGLRLNPNHDALGHLLTSKGYQCDYIGKWGLWAVEAGRLNAIRNAFCPPGHHWMGFDGFHAAYNIIPQNAHAVYYHDDGHRHEIDGWPPTVFTDLAIEQLNRRIASGHAFAMIVSYDATDSSSSHDTVPQSWKDHFSRVDFPAARSRELLHSMRRFHAATSGIDEQIGRVLNVLQETGTERQTIVVLTSARGEQHGIRFPLRADAVATADGSTNAAFNRSVRVPLLIRWPGRIPGGRKSNACISAVDVMPTLCGMLGIGYADSVEGIDLSDSTRVDCNCEPDFAFLQGMGHAEEWTDGFEWRAVRNQRFTYRRFRVDGREILIDNDSDPEHAVNLADHQDYAPDLQNLRQMMAEKQLVLNDRFQPSTWYRDNWIKNRIIMRNATGPFHREMGVDVAVDAALKP